MFTIYIDDSGSSPEHRLAIASGIIFPTKQLGRLGDEWNKLLEKECIPDFHSSACLARNSHSAFAGWDEIRIKRVFSRVRQITFKYSVKAFCIAIHKQDYNEVMPEDMRERVGSYYTWAASSVLGLAHDWATSRSVPIEYVFDTADKEVKREIDEAMEYSKSVYSDHFSAHYSFGKRKDVPALQAVDLFAWTCYQQGRHVRFKQPIHPLAQENWKAYEHANHSQWCVVQSLNRQGIEDWVKKTYLSSEDIKLKEFKEKLRQARTPKGKNRKPQGI
jgi:hypothetical protein